MNKCRICKKEFVPELGDDTKSFIGMVFGYEIAMLVIGAYGAACFYLLETVSAFIAASVVGVGLFYWLLPKRRSTCQLCIENESSEKI